MTIRRNKVLSSKSIKVHNRQLAMQCEYRFEDLLLGRVFEALPCRHDNLDELANTESHRNNAEAGSYISKRQQRNDNPKNIKQAFMHSRNYLKNGVRTDENL